MIDHIRGNRLLITLVIIYVAYVGIGWFTPRPYISSVVGILSLMAGTFMFARYAGKAWDILWKQERGKYGAHNAILGATELALGMCYSGMYRLIWNYYGSPETWSGTWFSSLGLFLVAKGAYRMAISPTDDINPHNFPDGFWNVVLWVFAIIIAFIAGTHFAGS